MLKTRRFILQTTAAALTASPPLALASPGSDKAFGGAALGHAIRQAEVASLGRLGVSVLDTANGARFAWRGDERFPLCSTFKFLLCAAILSEVDAGRERLDRAVPIAAADLTGNSPVTGRHVGPQGLPVSALCEAAIIWSDNAAANLLLPIIDGPAGLTRYARALGDLQTRLDRNEPTLNEAIPGDPRDTTTPNAMLADLDRVLLGEALLPASKQRLIGWLIDCRTGGARLRAGAPPGWRIGDKTGTGRRGSTNDIAVLSPPRRAALIVTAYLTNTEASPQTCDAALAAVGRAVAAAI